VATYDDDVYAWAFEQAQFPRESDAGSVTGHDDIVGDAYQLIFKLAISTKETK